MTKAQLRLKYITSIMLTCPRFYSITTGDSWHVNQVFKSICFNPAHTYNQQAESASAHPSVRASVTSTSKTAYDATCFQGKIRGAYLVHRCHQVATQQLLFNQPYFSKLLSTCFWQPFRIECFESIGFHYVSRRRSCLTGSVGCLLALSKWIRHVEAKLFFETVVSLVTKQAKNPSAYQLNSSDY